jgi:hypothetical protein
MALTCDDVVCKHRAGRGMQRHQASLAELGAADELPGSASATDPASQPSDNASANTEEPARRPRPQLWRLKRWRASPTPTRRKSFSQDRGTLGAGPKRSPRTEKPPRRIAAGFCAGSRL